MTIESLALGNERFYMSPSYAIGYIVFTVNSMEERLLGSILATTLGKSDKPLVSLLDIGSGDGRLTRRVATQFQHVTCYEPNPVLSDLCAATLSNIGVDATIHRVPFPKEPGGHEIHDVILASHSLYHVDQSTWPTFFHTTKRQLAPTGRLVVVLWNNESRARHYAEKISPERWVCSAEIVTTDTTQFSLSAAGFFIEKIIHVRPIIRARSTATAMLIFDFLTGAQEQKLAHGPLVEQFKHELLSDGISNDQTVMVLRRFDD